MTDKTSPAGWVVQVTVPAPPNAKAAQWYGPAVLGAPSFHYYNVAIAAPNKAIEATTKHLADAKGKEGEMYAIRGLSAGEIAVLKLKSGEVKPA